jgi:hypothetical protein
MSQRAVLLTSDLIFSTKVTGTARALGLEIAVAADVQKAAELCRGEPPGCVFIDLGIPGLEITSGRIAATQRGRHGPDRGLRLARGQGPARPGAGRRL